MVTGVYLGSGSLSYGNRAGGLDKQEEAQVPPDDGTIECDYA